LGPISNWCDELLTTPELFAACHAFHQSFPWDQQDRVFSSCSDAFTFPETRDSSLIVRQGLKFNDGHRLLVFVVIGALRSPYDDLAWSYTFGNTITCVYPRDAIPNDGDQGANQTEEPSPIPESDLVFGSGNTW